MDKMWSPWRSEYIDSFKKPVKDGSCIFCEAKVTDIKEDDCLVVYKSELAFIVLNLYPYNNGHLMVVPNRHLNDLRELTEAENSEIMSLLNKAISALETEFKPQGYNIGVNMGKAAGAGIDTHLHYHIVPRWNGDTNFMPVLGEVKVISQDLMVAKKKLIEAFQKL